MRLQTVDERKQLIARCKKEGLVKEEEAYILDAIADDDRFFLFLDDQKQLKVNMVEFQVKRN